MLGELTKLALLRRAVHIVGEQGYSNDKELATMLGKPARRSRGLLWAARN